MRTTNFPRPKPLLGYPYLTEAPLKNKRDPRWRQLESQFLARAWKEECLSSLDNPANLEKFAIRFPSGLPDKSQDAVEIVTQSLMTVTDPCIVDAQLLRVIGVILQRTGNDPEGGKLRPMNENPLRIPVTDPNAWAVLGAEAQRWFFMLLYQSRDILSMRMPTDLEIFSTNRGQHVGIRWNLGEPNTNLYEKFRAEVRKELAKDAKGMPGSGTSVLDAAAPKAGSAQTGLGRSEQFGGHDRQFGPQGDHAGGGVPAYPQNLPQRSQTFDSYGQQPDFPSHYAGFGLTDPQGFIQKSHTFGGFDQRSNLQYGSSNEPTQGSHTFGGYNERTGFQPGFAGSEMTNSQNFPQAGQAYGGYRQQSGSQQRQPGTGNPYPPPHPPDLSQQARYEMYSAPQGQSSDDPIVVEDDLPASLEGQAGSQSKKKKGSAGKERQGAVTKPKRKEKKKSQPWPTKSDPPPDHM